MKYNALGFPVLPQQQFLKISCFQVSVKANEIQLGEKTELKLLNNFNLSLELDRLKEWGKFPGPIRQQSWPK